MDGKSLNVVEEKLNDLKKILPEVFSEEKIDWEKLKAALGEDIEFREERYHLNWAGKSEAFRALQTPTTATLIPDKEESVNFDNTENLFIEGENLEVLKVLQKSYFGKIKMIYIDPPYNTGNDFIYSDKFAERREDYLKRSGTKDENGMITREGLFRNSKDSGHYHSNWLSMMYPRLFLTRTLLREDGVIFVSVDDNEVHNLRMLMNEVFGEENFVANVVWEKKYTRSNDAKWFSDNHDHILVYGKNKENLKFNLQPRSEEQLKSYHNPDNHPKGKWKATPLHAKSGTNITPYTFKNGITWSPPTGTYRRFNDETMRKMDYNDEIWFGENGKQIPQRKSFLVDVKEGVTPITIWKYKEAGHNHEANNEIKELGLTGIFTNPKPTKLIKLMNQLSTNNLTNDIIIDFFSGSCTTAHAVLDLNKEDGGNRKFIMVQMPEPCDERSEAYKAGYKTIAEIGKERIRRVINKIKTEDEGKFDFAKSKQDLGFKVFKLRQSNFKIWRSDRIGSKEELLRQMEKHADPLAKEAKIEDILYELLLKSGKELTSEIEYKDGIFWINKNEIAVVLEKFDENIMKVVITSKPEKLITLDRLFQNNDQFKTNTSLQMKDAGIEMRVV